MQARLPFNKLDRLLFGRSITSKKFMAGEHEFDTPHHYIMVLADADFVLHAGVKY